MRNTDEMVKDVSKFDNDWRQKWGSSADPVGWLLRGGPTWVRFHSLPGAKRYADNHDEEQEILSRHLTVITDLNGNKTTDLVVIPIFSSNDIRGSSSPGTEAFADALPWRAARADEVWDEIPAAGISPHAFTTEQLAPALKEIAEDGLLRIIVTNESADWLYAPYDGGADVLARNVAERDRLKVKYSGWLSQRSDGL